MKAGQRQTVSSSTRRQLSYKRMAVREHQAHSATPHSMKRGTVVYKMEVRRGTIRMATGEKGFSTASRDAASRWELNQVTFDDGTDEFSGSTGQIFAAPSSNRAVAVNSLN